MPTSREGEFFRLGVAFMDNEHQEIIQMMGDITTDSLGHARNGQEFYDVLLLLTEHFKHEEKEMTSYQYDLADEHKLSHSRFLSQMDRIADLMVYDPQGDESKHVIEFMLNWLKSHMMTADRQFATYLSGHLCQSPS